MEEHTTGIDLDTLKLTINCLIFFRKLCCAIRSIVQRNCIRHEHNRRFLFLDKRRDAIEQGILVNFLAVTADRADVASGSIGYLAISESYGWSATEDVKIFSKGSDAEGLVCQVLSIVFRLFGVADKSIATSPPIPGKRLLWLWINKTFRNNGSRAIIKTRLGNSPTICIWKVFHQNLGRCRIHQLEP